MSHSWPTAELNVAETAASCNATDKQTWYNAWTDWVKILHFSLPDALNKSIQ